jgi:Ca2+-binding RTX toxin-like protein
MVALVALSAAVPALATDVAAAANVEVKALYYKPVHEADAVVVVAAPGEANAVTMVQEGSAVVVRDRVALVAGSGCEAQADGAVRCTVTPGLSTFFRVRLGDRDDATQLEGGHYATVDGGRGDDHLVGLPDAPTQFRSGPGNDRMVGGRSYDAFSGGAKADGADTIIGGTAAPGQAVSTDAVSYEGRRQGVHVDRDGDRDDGAPGERDLIAADIEYISGSRGPDVLIGGAGTDHIDGNDGRDLIRGGPGTDYLRGDPWIVDRSRSQDRIHGGAGDDVLTGGAGGDRLTGGSGDDTIYAGPGPDRVYTRDDAADTVICGRGRDTLVLDALDFPRPDCERRSLG